MQRNVFSDLVVQKAKRRNRTSTLVGFGSVIMGGIAEVRFTIRTKKKDGLLIVNWPAHKATNDKWYDDVKICNKDLKEDLEKNILHTFSNLKEEQEVLED